MTTAPMQIITPTQSRTASEEDQTVAALVLAFSTDPVARWVWPEPQQYLAHAPGFFRAFGGPAFAQGTAYSIAGYAGAALWLPPSVDPDEHALSAHIASTVPARTQADLFTLLDQMARYHPGEPHWYLPLIGVDPALRGRGYGSMLLQHTLSECDRDGVAAYLESSNPRNLSLYHRHGFEILGTIQVGASPPIFPMLRRPR